MKLFELFGEIRIDDKNTIKTMDDVDKKGKSVGKQFGSMAKNVGKAGVAVGTFATLAGGAMLGFAKKTSDSLDEVDKMSQRIGFTTDAYQEWDFILNKVGGSMESTVGDFAMLSEKMMDASSGVGEGAELFEKLGINVTDSSGKLRSQQEVFAETITKLQEMEDVTQRNAIASALLGGTGEDLTPILNKNASEMEALRIQAHELGKVQSEETVKAGAEFSEALKDTTAMLSSMALEIGVKLLPIVNNFLVWVKESMPQIREFFTNAFNAIQPVITNMYTMFRDNILPILKSLFGWVMDNMPIFKETFITIFDAIWTVVNSVWELFEISLLPILKLLFSWVDENMETIGDVIGGTFEVIGGIIETTIGVIDDVISTLKSAYEWATKFLDKNEQLENADKGTQGTVRSGSGFGGVSSFGGMRANGGPVSAGSAYIVGEKEAEMFVPKQDGMVYNQEQMSAMGGVTVKQMIVRKESDIEDIARKLFNLQRSTNRGYAL